MLNSATIWVILRSTDMFAFGSIIECLSRHMGYMSESIPLSSALCIELIHVIISYAFDQWLDFVLECLSGEGGNFWDIQWQVESDNLSGYDLL